MQFKTLILAGALCTGGAATAAWLGLGQRDLPSSPAEMAMASPSATPKIVESPSSGQKNAQSSTAVAATTPIPDPRFKRSVLPKLIAVSVPEAARMVADMQDAYRCVHSGNKRTLACLAPTAGDEPVDLESLAVTLRQSLGTLPDSCYVNAALPQVANPRTPKALMSVLYDDLERRPDPIKLRTLFVIASIPSHPLAADALKSLESLTHADFQNDWSRWDQAISQQLVHEDRGMRGASCRVH
jgi:hypothetical protein